MFAVKLINIMKILVRYVRANVTNNHAYLISNYRVCITCIEKISTNQDKML